MATPFIGEISIVSFNFAPRGWTFCQGQVVVISQNEALFGVIGTIYGGNGTTTFALPDLRGRTPIHWGQGPGLPSYTIGQLGGEENHTLTIPEMPLHNHLANASKTADASSPASNYWAASGNEVYATGSDSTMKADAIGLAGSGQGHPNMQPYLAVNFCIALLGIFPSRN